MKQILKQKIFVLAVTFFILAVVLALGMSIHHRPAAVLGKVIEALETGDAQKYAECFRTEKQEDAELEFYWSYGLMQNETMHILYGDTEEVNDDEKKASIFVLYNQNGEWQRVELKKYNIVTVDGEQYID